MSLFNAVVVTAAALLGLTWCEEARDAYANTESGRVRGLIRMAENNVEYASFRGVPYAKQPLGDLRFKELEPAEPWDLLDASTEGPVCPQIDKLFGHLVQPKNQSEACIYANIHVPLNVLPAEDGDETTTGVPVFVFIHGGSFQAGSGDSDLYGPEYLVSKGAIVITFNYRLNVFGFLSLNSSSIPGNQGLRDMLTLLKWVQKNVRSFGGNPDEVTLAGHSSGAVCAHLLAMSPLSEGLFKRVILVSGTAIQTVYTTSPVYAQTMANQLLTNLGINSTDTAEIHTQLIDLPLNTIMTAYNDVQDSGIVAFTPVVESPFEGVPIMVPQTPEEMVKAGLGSSRTYVIGFNTAECHSLQLRFKELNPLPAIEQSPLALLPLKLIYATPEDALPNTTLLEIATTLEKKYFNGTVTFEKYLDYCYERFFVNSVLKLAQLRAAVGGAPTYMYQFSYAPKSSVVKKTFGLEYDGVGHFEDILHIFRANYQLGDHQTFPPTNNDDTMIELATNMTVNYMNTGGPPDSTLWPAVNSTLMYQDIKAPQECRLSELTEEQKEILAMFSGI